MSDSNEFFSTPEVSAHLDLIRHLIENSELVPLVRGAAGIGKTLMASRLQQSAPDNWAVCHFSADPTLQPERLLAFIARCSGLPDIAGDLMQRLVDRFEVLRKRGRIPVLLVDDAQMLPPTSLMTLLRLFERQVEGARLVSIVLFADEQIDLLLATPQLQVMSPQAIQAIDMPVLTRQEATAFMHFLLKNEGLSEHFALDEARLGKLHKEAGGIPGLLATEILSDIGQESDAKQPFFSGYRKQLLLGGAPILALVVMLLLFQERINRLFEPDVEISSAPALSGEVAPDSVETDPPVKATAEVKQEEPPELVLPKPEQSLPAPAVTVAPLPDPVEQVEPSVVFEPADVVAEVEKITPLPDPEPAQNEPVSTEEAPSSPASDDAAADVEKEEAELQEAVVAEKPQNPAELETPASPQGALAAPAADPVTPDSEVVVEVADVVAEPVPAPLQPPADEVDRDGYGKALEWVLSQPPQYYTLQLIAVENVESLQRFIKNNGLEEQAFTLKTQRNGAPWYALLWGAFEDRERALQAQTALPSAVQKGGVWARPFASLR